MTTKRIEDMSDEEISALSPEAFAALAQAEGDGESNEGEDDNNTQAGDTGEDEGRNPADEEEARRAEEEAARVAAEANADKGDDDGKDEGKTAPSGKANGAEAGEGDDEATAEGKKAAAVKEDAKVDPKDGQTSADEQIKALFAPFKANGRDIQVNSVDEARQLMSMGANYNKKMQAMKPHLATLRTLENAKIGEAELNFLIDVHNGVPEAINKLVKDRGIDPMDLAPEKADGYKPGNHKASDKEVELDSVLHELDGSAGLDKTVNIVSKVWDNASRKIVADNPQLLKIINGHVESGIYDQIAARIERERTFGRLQGLTDLEAYRQVGDAMEAKGEFVSAKGSSPSDQQAAGAPAVVTPDPKKADDSKRNAQKRGVAPVKGKAPATQNPDFNPLSLSDEDFMKQFSKKF
jgi:hypothetical protein